jgi:hypothetical protein
MASPFVAGVTGLLRSANPGWTAIQTKNAIMNRGDNPDAMVCCLSVSDGRVNAYMPLAVPNTSNATARHDGVMSKRRPDHLQDERRGSRGEGHERHLQDLAPSRTHLRGALEGPSPPGLRSVRVEAGA